MSIIWSDSFESGLGSWTLNTAGGNSISQSSGVAYDQTYSASFSISGFPSSPVYSMYRSAGSMGSLLNTLDLFFRIKDWDPRALVYAPGTLDTPWALLTLWNSARSTAHFVVSMVPAFTNVATGKPALVMQVSKTGQTPTFSAGFMGLVYPEEWHHLRVDMPLGRVASGVFEFSLDNQAVFRMTYGTSSLGNTQTIEVGNWVGGASIPRFGAVYHVDLVSAATSSSDLVFPKRVLQDRHGRVARC